MYVEFEIFLDLILVSLMHLCLFIIYKYSPSNRSSNGGFGENLQNWPYVYVSEIGIFSLFDFSPFELTFVDSKVVLISLETFSHH